MKNKYKKFIKKNIGHIYTAIITALVTGSVSVSAAVMISASNIAYNDNGNVSTVKEALDTLYSSVDVATILPAGSIIPYMGTTAPTNYLICDGSTYNISDYKKLADHIKDDFGSYNFFGGDGETTFAVPDLRGEFLRGSGTNSHENQGNGASVGEHQDATKHVNLTFWTNNNNTSTAYTVYPVNATNSSGLEGSNYDATTQSNYFVDNWSNTARGSRSNVKSLYTSRPTNTSVNYIIKVK